MPFVFADADNPSYRTVVRRRNKDLAFLEQLRRADEDELDRLAWERADRPRWQQIAISRAHARAQGVR